MKKVLLKVLTFILALCCVGLVACGEPEGPKASLVDFENSTVSIKIGLNYNLAEYVYDTDGNRYDLTASVTDVDGEKVDAEEGFFQVNKASYSVVYSVDFAGENKTKTVTVKGVSVPSIELENYQEQTYTLGILPAELPAINAEDFIDGKITEVTKAVYKVTPYENIKMTDYDGKSNFYQPKSIGTYYWEVTVTNSAGQTSTRQLYFFVTADPGEYNILCVDGEENRFKSSKSLVYDYVEFDEIPTEGIDNGIGYNGHAYKIGNIPHNASITTELSYTAKEYLALEAAGKFNAVQFYYMIDSTRHPERTQIRNNDQRLPGQEYESFNGNWTFFSGAGHYAVRKSPDSAALSKDNRYITTNQWRCITVPVSEFVKTLGTGKTGKVLMSFMWDSSDTVDLYMSDVMFTTYDWTKVPYQGEYGITFNENNYDKITITGKGATIEYAENSQFPEQTSYMKKITELVFNEDGTPALDENGKQLTETRYEETFETVTNLYGYSGNAAKVNIPHNNKYVYANFNYTAQQYLNLEKEGKFNAVKISLMSESGYHNETYGVYAALGFAKKSIPRAQWQTYLLTVEEFANCFEAMDSNKALIYRSYLTNSGEHDLYVGDIEFITFDWDNEVIYADNYNIEPVESSLAMLSINSSATSEIVSAEQFPTTDGDRVVENPINYDGDAIKISIPSSAKGIALNMNYTGAQYRYIAEKEGFNSVKITYLYTGGSATYTEGTLLKTLGPVKYKWTTSILTIDEFVASFGNMVKPEGASNYTAFETDETSKKLILRTDSWCDPHQFYLGGIELISYDLAHEHTGGTATCKDYAVCDGCGQPYGDLLPHANIVVDKEAVAPTATQAGLTASSKCADCETVLSEQQSIPALNVVPSVDVLANVDVSSKTTVEYIEGANLPTQLKWTAKENVLDAEGNPVKNPVLDAEGNPVLDADGNPKFENVKQDVEKTKDIINKIGFAGDVIKVSSAASGRGIVLNMAYTGAEFKSYAEADGKNAVKITYLTMTSDNTLGVMQNNEGCLINVMGDVRGAWTTSILTLDQFVGAFGKCVKPNETASNQSAFEADINSKDLIIRTDAYSTGTWEFFFSGIELIAYDFEHEHTGGTATCLAFASCTICGQPYGELAPHGEEIVAEAGKAPTATETGLTASAKCSVCDKVLSEQKVIPALNYVPVEADIDNYSVSSSTTKTYYAAGSLPTEMVYGTDGANSIAIDNSMGYDGSAIAVQTSATGRGLVVTMPYTGAQYREYAQANSYNAVKMWMAVVATSSSFGGDAGTMLNTYGAVRNKWVPVVLTIDQFVSTFGTMTKAEGASMAQVFTPVDTENTIVYRTQRANPGTWAIYVGTMEFITYDFDHEHTGGTATCNALASCEVCGIAYGNFAAHTESTEIQASNPTGTTPGMSAKIVCTVCGETVSEQQEIPALNMVVSEATAAHIYETASGSPKYLSAAEIPTSRQVDSGNVDTETGEPIMNTITFDNSISYTGNAIEITGYSNAKYAGIYPAAFNYDYEELVALKDAGAFTHVSFHYLWAGSGNGGNNSSTASFITKAKTGIVKDAWTVATISAEDFLATYADGRYYLLRSSSLSGALYIGDFEFLKIDTTELSLIDWSAEPSTQVRQLLLAKNNADATIRAEKASFVVNKQLPTKSLYTHNEADISYDQSAYANAYKLTVVSNGAIYLNIRYTADQIKALATEKGYTQISFTYLFDATYHKNGLVNTRGGGEGACGNMSSSKCNVIRTETWSIEEFCAFIAKTISNEEGYTTSPVEIGATELLLNFGFRGADTFLYIYDLSFVAPVVEA